jgi:hypothetical protein
MGAFPVAFARSAAKADRAIETRSWTIGREPVAPSAGSFRACLVWRLGIMNLEQCLLL